MSNQVFRQNLNDKKGPQPGGPYLIQMLFKGKGQILRPTPNTAPLICGACYSTQPEDLLTMA